VGGGLYFLYAIGKAIAVTGLVTHVSTYITGWRIDVRADSATLWMSGQPGAFTVSDATEQFPWQPALEQCASAFGIRLPEALAPGTEVRWQIVENAGLDGYAPLIVEQSSDAAIPPSGPPTFRFVTGTDPFPDGNELVFDRATVVARVANSDLRQVLDLTKQLIGDAVGGIVAGALPPVPGLAEEVRGTLQQIYNPALEQLDAAITTGSRSVFELTAQDAVYVYYHGQDDEEPEPEPEPGAEPPAPPADPADGVGDRDRFCAIMFAEGALGDSFDLFGSNPEIGAEGVQRITDASPYAPADLTSQLALMLEVYTWVANGATIGELANSGEMENFAYAMIDVATYCGIPVS